MRLRIAAAFLASGFLAPAALAQPACTEIIATGHPEYPPVGFPDGGRIGGAGALLVAEVAAKLGVPVRFDNPPTWEASLDSVRAGVADLIFGIYRTEERLDWLTFVDPPFLQDTAVAMVSADAPFPFAGQDDLVGRRGVSTIGDSWGATFDAFIAARLDVARVDGTEAVFDMLLAGQADYAIVGLYPALAYASANGLTDRITTLSPPVSAEPLYIAFAASSPCAELAGRFGEEIAAAVAGGHMDELVAEAEAAWNAGRGR